MVGERLATDRGEDMEPYFAAAGLGARLRRLGYREDIPALLAAADIFALPSHFEGLPMSVIEAMLCGAAGGRDRHPRPARAGGGRATPDSWSRPRRSAPLAAALRASAAGRAPCARAWAPPAGRGRWPSTTRRRWWCARWTCSDLLGYRLTRMTDIVPIRRALISVSDKTGLVPFAQALAATWRGNPLHRRLGARHCATAGIAVKEVSEHTGFPEILDGRVKTLVPQIHGGILGRRDDAEHLAQMRAHGIAPIDLVAVNLYPFEATVAGGADFDDCVENIDIGGPALIRAAAKNHDFVAVLTEPDAIRAGAGANSPPHGGTHARAAPPARRRRLSRAPPPMTPPSPLVRRAAGRGVSRRG